MAALSFRASTYNRRTLRLIPREDGDRVEEVLLVDNQEMKVGHDQANDPDTLGEDEVGGEFDGIDLGRKQSKS